MASFKVQAKANPTFTEGGINSGSYSDTLTSDDTRFILSDSGGAPANKFKLDFSFDGVSPSDQLEDAIGVNETTITEIKITLEARDTLSTDDYYLLLWNFNSSAWDEVGAVMSISSTDATFTRNITVNYSDYVSSDELKVRLANGKALGKGGAPNNNGQLEIDYLAIDITNVGSIAFGGISSFSTSQTPTSVSVSGTNTIGIVNVIGESGGDNITAVTWDGNPMTKIAAVQVPGDRFISSWYILNPTSGTSTISFTGGSFWRSLSSYYTGVKQSGQVDSSNTGTSSSNAAITVATTVVAENCWTIMFQKDGVGGKTYTTSVGTIRYDVDDGGIAISDSDGTVGTGSQSTTLTQTVSTSNHGGIAFSIAPLVAVTFIPKVMMF